MNHLMSLRDDQRAATRRRIVQAVGELVTDTHPANISVPAVAAKADVGVATVYRYFPTKESLLDAAAAGAIESGNRLAEEAPTTIEGLRELLGLSWTQLAEQLPLVRNQMASPVGRDLRRRRHEVKRVQVGKALAHAGIDPDTPEGARLFAVLDVLTSSTALLELHDKAGLPVEEAVADVLWAIDVLMAASR
jgi:AcrR family transcriptional regulator